MIWDGFWFKVPAFSRVDRNTAALQSFAFLCFLPPLVIVKVTKKVELLLIMMLSRDNRHIMHSAS